MKLKIENMRAFKESLRKVKQEMGKSPIVSAKLYYEAYYATYVHEMPAFKSPTTLGTRPKFLEEPARTKSVEVGGRVVEQLESGKTLRESVRRGALLLMYYSKEIAPKDTGHLREESWKVEMETQQELQSL